jgi:hypothetical protein
MACKKPVVATVNSKESGERILKEKRPEVRMSRDYCQGVFQIMSYIVM